MISASLRAIGGSALRTLLAFLLLICLLPAVSMVRVAAAEDTVNANAGTSAEANANDNANAAVSTETKAETEALGTAVGGFWRVAWNKSWPFIKGIFVKSWDATVGIFSLIGRAFKEMGGSVKVDANANLSGVELVNVNGSVEVQ